MTFGPKQLLLTTALVGVIAPAAAAQENPFLRGRHTAVTERAQPEFDPEPLRAGAFVIDANILGAVEFNDNVYAQETNKVDDTIIRVRPEVIARSNWSVHALTVGATVDHRQFTGEDSETATDYNLFANGRLDVTRNFSFTGNAATGQTTEARYEPGSQFAPEPAHDKYVTADIGASYRSDRLLLQGQVGASQHNYQDFYPQRDFDETFVGGRVSYAISPDVAVFADVRQAELDYDDTALINRDGTQTSLRAGVNFELSAPFRGEIAVGQVNDKRDAPGSEDAKSASVDAAVEWFPTQLTTVTFRGFAGITDPGIQEALSADTQRYSVRVDHELLRNILLHAEAGFGTYKYNASPLFPTYDRQDDFTDVNIGGAYKLNKNARVEAGYTFHNRDSSGVGATSLDQNVFSVGLRLYP
ncbi:MAG: hypothetical protein EON61_07380 [Alphaproteobacteria bacterium]|jgi:hypothetical protein|nr:MAG: hypothetical protein EON61_07380 [Alphaproteobacteria bacterium]